MFQKDADLARLFADLPGISLWNLEAHCLLRTTCPSSANVLFINIFRILFG